MIRLAARSWLVALALALAPRAHAGAPDPHLLEGARLFRDGRFDAALVEFRMAERLGRSGAAQWYASASLVMLGRHEEAIEAFAAAAAAHPHLRDGLLDYYRAVACYEERLYVTADGILAGIRDVGPRVGEQVSELRARIARALEAEPRRTTIDWYHARADASRRAARPGLAASYAREALELAARRGDHYRADEARAVLAAASAAGDAERAR